MPLICTIGLVTRAFQMRRNANANSNASSVSSTVTFADTSSATATVTITQSKATDENDAKKPKTMSLKLKGTPKQKERTSRHIHWSQDTIDNEDLNKKKSNRKIKQDELVLFIFVLVCCIFHPNDEDCCKDHLNDYEIPEGKNVYDHQPKYKKKG